MTLIEFLKLYATFRIYAQHEDGLMSNRLMWNLTVQGFMFAAYGFSLQKLVEVQGHNEPTAIAAMLGLYGLILVLPLLGIATSYLSWQGVCAAQVAIYALETKWNEVRAKCPEHAALVPGLLGGGAPRKEVVRGGFYAPYWLPWLFIVAWAALLLSFGAAHLKYYLLLF